MVAAAVAVAVAAAMVVVRLPVGSSCEGHIGS